MKISQFKKILPALRLIEPPPGLKNADRTFDWSLGQSMVITARDMSTELEVKVVGVESTLGAGCTNFDKFNKLITSLKEMPSFAEGDGLSVKLGKRLINLDHVIYSKRMDYGNRDLFGAHDTYQDHQWDVPKLVAGLDYVAPAMSTEETRFHLNGILIAPGGDMVATDGHRLHRYEYQGARTEPIVLGGYDVILFRKHARILQAAIKACGGDKAMVYSKQARNYMEWTVDGGGLSFNFVAKLIDSKFPSYQSVIPKSHRARAVVNTAAFVEASKLLAKMSDTANKTVEFALNGQLHLKGSGVSESLEAPYTGEGFKFGEIGANATYLEQAARFPLDDFTIEFGKALEPIKLTQRGGYLAVVMPQRC